MSPRFGSWTEIRKTSRLLRRAGDRRGMTLVELAVAMTAGLLLTAGVAPAFMLMSRGIEQQRAMQQVQAGTHIAAETLLRGIRGADGVLEGSTSTRLLMEGGPFTRLCGEDRYWIEVQGGELLCGPEGEGWVRRIVGDVDQVGLTYGFDEDDDGFVESFRNSVGTGEGGDVMAVRFQLGLSIEEGRGVFRADTEFVAVIRNAILGRVELGDG